MNLYINGKETKVELFVTPLILKERFSVENKGIPSLFLITGDLLPDEKVTVEDIRNNISTDLNKFVEDVQKLSLKFNLSVQDILMLWIMVVYGEIHKPTLEAIELDKIFGKINPTFLRLDTIIETYSRFVKDFNRIHDDVENKFNIVTEVSNYINEIESPTFSNFYVTQSIWEINLNIKVSLITIFDNMELTETLPFASLKYERDFFKVYEGVTPKEDWIEAKDELTFYVKVKGSFVKCKYGEILTFSLQEVISYKTITDEFFKSISSLNPKIIKVESQRVKGSFTIEFKDEINQFLLADMVMNDNILSYFLFANEENALLTKSSLGEKGKKRRSYSLYYRPGRDFDKNSPILTLGFKKELLDIKVSKLSNVKYAPILQEMFSKLINVYFLSVEDLANEYNNMNVSFKTEKLKEGIDKKSGKRLKELRLRRPDLFSGSFSTVCQHENKQPYLIEPEKVEEYKRWAVKKTGENIPDKFVLNFPKESNDWYGCLPRKGEILSGHHPPAPYPSITINNKEDKEERPCFPCCTSKLGTTALQATKKRENLFKRCGKVKTEKSTTNLGHILAPIKRANPGRFGQLPGLIFKLASKSFTFDIEGQTKFFSLLRYGVSESPDSFLRCLICATDNSYFTSNKQKRDNLVNEQKEEILKHINRPFQSLYNKDKDQIIFEISSGYFSPREYIDLFEEYFGVNIFLFGVTEKHPLGKILIPKSSVAYFPKIKHKQSIFICVFYKSSRIVTPFQTQSELLVNYGDELITTFDKNHSFVKRYIRVYSLTNITTRV